MRIFFCDSALVTKIQKLTNKNEGINVSVGLINGGTSVNTIPNYASIDIDVRTSQLEQAPLIEQKIRDIVEQDESNAAKVLISGGMDRPPMELTNDNLELSNLIIDIAKELGISLKAVSAGGGSDASFTSALGVTTIDGLGPIGGNQHNEDEYLEIDSLKERKKLLEVVISKLSKNVVKQLENI